MLFFNGYTNRRVESFCLGGFFCLLKLSKDVCFLLILLVCPVPIDPQTGMGGREPLF